MSGPHPTREYQLTIRQEPKQARMCGVGGKADRRPIDPPPIIQLRVIDPPADSNDPSANHDPAAFLQNPYYFMFACLAKPDDDTELHWLKDGRTKCTTGSVVSSLYHLRDTDSADNADVGFFVFPDLSVRTEGSYRLKLSLYEIVGNSVRHCKSIFSAPFYVFTAKKFPGMEESTPLSCSLADQGIKIRIRKDIRSRKRPQSQNVPLSAVGAGDGGGGGSSMDRQFSRDNEPPSPASSRSSLEVDRRSGKRRKIGDADHAEDEPDSGMQSAQPRWGTSTLDSRNGQPIIPPPPGATRSDTPPGPQAESSSSVQAMDTQPTGPSTSTDAQSTPHNGATAYSRPAVSWSPYPPPPSAPPPPSMPPPAQQQSYETTPTQPNASVPQSYYYPPPPPPQYSYPPHYAPYSTPGPPQHTSWGYDPYYGHHQPYPHGAPQHPQHPQPPHHQQYPPPPHAPPPPPPPTSSPYPVRYDHTYGAPPPPQAYPGYHYDHHGHPAPPPHYPDYPPPPPPLPPSTPASGAPSQSATTSTPSVPDHSLNKDQQEQAQAQTKPTESPAVSHAVPPYGVPPRAPYPYHGHPHPPPPGPPPPLPAHAQGHWYTSSHGPPPPHPPPPGPPPPPGQPHGHPGSVQHQQQYGGHHQHAQHHYAPVAPPPPGPPPPQVNSSVSAGSPPPPSTTTTGTSAAPSTVNGHGNGSYSPAPSSWDANSAGGGGGGYGGYRNHTASPPPPPPGPPPPASSTPSSGGYGTEGRIQLAPLKSSSSTSVPGVGSSSGSTQQEPHPPPPPPSLLTPRHDSGYGHSPHHGHGHGHNQHHSHGHHGHTHSHSHAYGHGHSGPGMSGHESSRRPGSSYGSESDERTGGGVDGRTNGNVSMNGSGNGSEGRGKLDIRNIVEGPMAHRDRDGYDS